MLKQHKEHITFVKRASAEMVNVRAVLERTKAENKARRATCTLGLPHTHEPSEQELRETKAKLEQQLLDRGAGQAGELTEAENKARRATCTLVPATLTRTLGAGAARDQGQAGAAAARARPGDPTHVLGAGAARRQDRAGAASPRAQSWRGMHAS